MHVTRFIQNSVPYKPELRVEWCVTKIYLTKKQFNYKPQAVRRGKRKPPQPQQRRASPRAPRTPCGGGGPRAHVSDLMHGSPAAACIAEEHLGALLSEAGGADLGCPGYSGHRTATIITRPTPVRLLPSHPPPPTPPPSPLSLSNRHPPDRSEMRGSSSQSSCVL